MATTAKQLYEGFLIDIGKEDSPALHIREWNHLVNKAVDLFINKIYTAFETSQKSLDYLKAINTTANITQFFPSADKENTFTFALPADYRALTNLIVFYTVQRPIRDKCYPVGDVIPVNVRKRS
jgi:hypothetical protein